ncbi:MAG: putative 2OG-Fe(II) oxygenase [Lysobacterales bacterium]
MVKRIRPEAGLMLLFPSYFYHGTVPFDYDAQRISIAFDILPLSSPSP